MGLVPRCDQGSNPRRLYRTETTSGCEFANQCAVTGPHTWSSYVDSRKRKGTARGMPADRKQKSGVGRGLGRGWCRAGERGGCGRLSLSFDSASVWTLPWLCLASTRALFTCAESQLAGASRFRHCFCRKESCSLCFISLLRTGKRCGIAVFLLLCAWAIVAGSAEQEVLQRVEC